MLDSKVYKQRRVIILRSQAGISQIARNIRPILKTPEIKYLRSSVMMNGTIPLDRHSLNMISRPVLPFPS